MNQDEGNDGANSHLKRNRYENTILVTKAILTKGEIFAGSLLTGLLYFGCHRNDVVNSERWKILGSLLCLLVFLLFVRRIFWGVKAESIFIVKTLGLQKTTVYHSNFKSSVFIPWHCIKDVIINEAIVMQKVIFYLAVLVRNENKDEGESLIPIFIHSRPRLAKLKEIYREIQLILSH